MSKSRLEAFSDGVIAIIITIMRLGMKVPHGSEFSALQPLIPVFLSYLLSFVYVGIYWNNHHHMMEATRSVNGAVLLANLHLLFWLSMIPFVTGRMGENHFAAAPSLLYGIVLFCNAIAYLLLQQTIIRMRGRGSQLRNLVGSDIKGKLSVQLYVLAVFAAFLNRNIAQAIYAAVALIWIVPDTRIERALEQQPN